MSRSIVVGVDGATFSLLDKWMKAGELPNFQALQQRGFRTELRSIMPYYSAPAWTSIVTGKQPNKHGIFDFFYREGEQLKTVNSTMRQSHAIWNVLNEFDGQSIVLNVPGTYPAEEFNGSMVTGMLTPSADDEGFTHPLELRDKLDEYSLDSWWQMLPFLIYSQTRPEKALDLAEGVVDDRMKVATSLMRETDWDLTFLVLRITDTVQHFLWEHEELALALYKQIDDYLGEMREEFGDANICVMSDHGFRSSERTFYINNFLYNEGYLATNSPPDRNLKFALSNVGEEVIKLLSTVFPVEVLLENPLSRRFLSDTISKDIDWDETEAFSLSASASGVTITAEGKRRDELVDQLVADLRALRDPKTGEPVLADVYAREDLYPNGDVEKAPDVIFTLEDTYTISDLVVTPDLGLTDVVRSQGDLPVTTDRLGYQHSGEHARNGILLMDGPDIVNGQVPECEVLDIMPTLLSLLDKPIPDDLDGEPIDEAISESSDHEYVSLEDRRQVASDNKQNESVKERLQDLGYLG